MPVLKAIVTLLMVGFFAFELFRRHSDFASRWIIAAAAAISTYELLHRENFGNIVFLIVIAFALYAWRNWFVSLCALLVLMAFLNNIDTPHGIAGIQGLNPWNLLMLNVFLSWWCHRRHEGLSWDMPQQIVVLALGLYLVNFWSYARLAFDYQELNVLNTSEDLKKASYSFVWVTSEYLVNPMKWLLPGILLYDACRTRHRTVIALSFILLIYVLLGIQVVKSMPLQATTADAAELARISARFLGAIGYFRTELSMMLAGASWAILSCVVLAGKRSYQLLLVAAAALVAVGQAMTGGRAGYVTWGLTGLVLCVLRWRRLLPAIPVAIIAIALFLPGVTQRMLTGFGGTQDGVSTETDVYRISAGRTIAWSYVIPKILDSPLVGYGRQAMIRAGVYQKILADTDGDESFPHPHNAYLEMLLDNGLVGFFLVLPLYFVVLFHSFNLLMDRSDPLFSAVGGAASGLLLGLMIAAMCAETFYPQDSSVGMWAAVGVMLRVYVERARSRATGEPLFGERKEDELVVNDESLPEIATPA